MQNINYANLPAYYYLNKSAWMQVSIFNDIFLKLTKIWKNKIEIFLLLADNTPVHIILEETAEKLDCIAG